MHTCTDFCTKLPHVWRDVMHAAYCRGEHKGRLVAFDAVWVMYAVDVLAQMDDDTDDFSRTQALKQISVAASRLANSVDLQLRYKK